MSDKLFTYLRYEQGVLSELLELARKQQTALVNFDINVLQEIAQYQLDLSKNLREAEDRRIQLLSSWLGITRNEALKLTLGKLEKYYAGENLTELVALKQELKKLLDGLSSVNLTNRVLANRAKRSVQEVLQIVTNGGNHFYNVKV